MRKTKMQRGITLIALIITIIILLILAVVTIGSIKDSNIITYAQNAATDYTAKSNEEEGIISNYEAIIKENLPGGDKVTYTNEGVPIPAGFYYVTGTKDIGLVISDSKLDEENPDGKDGNQFVWVPVSKINDMVMCPVHGRKGTLNEETLQCSDCGENTKLVGRVSYETTYSETSHREPGVVTKVYNSETRVYDIDGADMDSTYLVKAGLTTDLTGDSQIDEKDFEYQLQKEFNEMVTSVAKYKGFYVGRYETSMNGTNPQSKSGVVSATAAGYSADTWYGLYKLNKEYTTSTVKSSMIWGSQYDAMMLWMGDDLKNFDTNNRNTGRETGSVSTDVIRNVYDLGGNSYEWTLEAYNTSFRISRGGGYDYSSSPSYRLYRQQSDRALW